MRTTYSLSSLIIAVVIAAASANAQTVPWANGDFELGNTLWTFGASTTFADHDGDGDAEAHFLADGGWFYHLSIGFAKGPVPANTPLSFDIEQGSMFMDFRMIIACATDPVPYLPVSPFDDMVLSWTNGWAPASGHMVLDPVQATGVNIPGWADMGAEERDLFLSACVHGTIVMYAVASGFNGGATVDDFAWEL